MENSVIWLGGIFSCYVGHLGFGLAECLPFFHDHLAGNICHGQSPRASNECTTKSALTWCKDTHEW